MKELSIEKKAKAYDEAIKKAKEFKNNPFAGYDGTDLISALFPELKESENDDERIRKAIIEHLISLNNGYYKRPSEDIIDKWIAWLEKQGEKMSDPRYNILDKLIEADSIYQMAMNDAMVEEAKNKAIEALSKLEVSKLLWKLSDKATPKFKVGDSIKTTNEEPLTITEITDSGYWSEDLFICGFDDADKWELVEQKHADKVEPKFHEGDWIVSDLDKKARQISEVHFDEYNSYYVVDGKSVNLEEYDRLHHLWTIQDAKAGDVLIDKSNGRECPFIFKATKPSEIKTDILNPLAVLGYCGIGGAGFTKGSGWGDTANCIYYPATKEQRDTLMKAMADAEYTFDFENKELNKIEQKAWSEEDERMFEYALDMIEWYSGKNEDKSRLVSDWLKFLKDRVQPQSQWKPSDEQIGVIEAVINNRSFQRRHLDSLYEQLKKLKGE